MNFIYHFNLGSVMLLLAALFCLVWLATWMVSETGSYFSTAVLNA